MLSTPPLPVKAETSLSSSKPLAKITSSAVVSSAYTTGSDVQSIAVPIKPEKILFIDFFIIKSNSLTIIFITFYHKIHIMSIYFMNFYSVIFIYPFCQLLKAYSSIAESLSVFLKQSVLYLKNSIL